MKILHEHHIRPKLIIKPNGKLLFVFAHPECINHYIHTEAVYTEKKELKKEEENKGEDKKDESKRKGSKASLFCCHQK